MGQSCNSLILIALYPTTKIYNNHLGYMSIKMKKITIEISKDIKEQMREFRFKGESYSDLIKRLIESAKKRQIHDLLMSEEGFIPIEKALSDAKKQWKEQ